MNDLDYARMIEIPVNTCSITYKRPKRLWFKHPDSLKRELIDVVNEEAPLDFEQEQTIPESPVCEFADTIEITTATVERKRKKLSSPRRFDFVSAQIAVVVVLALTVMFTNIFWRDSGINTLVRGVFTEGDVGKVEDKAYDKFVAYSPVRSADVTLSEGVMTFSGGGSIYPVCDGKITKVVENAQKFDVSVEYSPSFTALISGVDYAFYSQGDNVYKSLPVCYSSGGEVKVYLYNDGKLLTNYTVDNGKIVWQS